MPYIGSVPTSSFTSLAKQDITGNGGTNYTLNHPVTNANDVAVFVNNVRQEPTEAYTASGTTLAMTGAINSSDNFYVIFLGQAIQTSNPPDGSVSTSQIANDSVTSAKTNFVSTSSVAGLQIKGDGTTDGTLQLNCSQNSHGIKLKSPNHGAGQSYTLTFPPTAPQADKTLITDASGNLSFANASAAGSGAFAARMTSSAWVSASSGTIIPFNNVSTGDSFDTDSCYNTSTYKYTAPATGVYLFWYAIYTAQNDASNSFSFLKNSSKVNMQPDSANIFTHVSSSSNDHIQNGTVILPLTSGNTIAPVMHLASDYYSGHSQWGGCRLA